MTILYHHRTRATDAQRVHIREIIQAFRKLGHQVEVAALVDAEKEQQDAAREAEEAGWKKLILRIPLAYELVQLAYNFFAVPWLVWKILRTGTGLVYERYSLFNFAGVLAARIARRPVVLEVNSPFALEQHQLKEIRAAAFAGWMERVICNAATKVIVVSGPLRRILLAGGVRDSKLVLMHNGVNLDHFRTAEDSQALRNSLQLEGKVVIGFAGWFRPWHGLEFLLESFHNAGLAKRGAALLLIGDGPATAGLKQYAAEHGLGDCVVFTGPVPHERIQPFLNIVDIAVQPAANEYCCPMKILEYMGLGKAIAAPRQENIEELVADGREALLFSPGNAAGFAAVLSRLVEDAELRRRLGKGALDAIHRRELLWTRNAGRVIEMGSAADGRSAVPVRV